MNLTYRQLWPPCLGAIDMIFTLKELSPSQQWRAGLEVTCASLFFTLSVNSYTSFKMFQRFTSIASGFSTFSVGVLFSFFFLHLATFNFEWPRVYFFSFFFFLPTLDYFSTLWIQFLCLSKWVRSARVSPPLLKDHVSPWSSLKAHTSPKLMLN